WSEAIRACGLKVEVLERIRKRRIYPSVRNFLRIIKSMGASHASNSYYPLTRDVFIRMENFYDVNFKHKNGIRVTFEIILFIAKK
ncbi:MAG: hypothetical protein KM296_07095, partial [Brockia lithotrophica]|nr:hypothetical protein [Brockia lithotrophica]